MAALEGLVVGKKLVKCDRLEVIHVHTGIEHAGPAHDQRPVVVARVIVDMAVDHVAAPRLRITEHRIVAHRDEPSVYRHLFQRLDAFEVVGKRNAIRL